MIVRREAFQALPRDPERDQARRREQRAAPGFLLVWKRQGFRRKSAIAAQ
jgi:hypothetical protein